MQDSLEKYAIGVDIGGTGTKYGIVDHRGRITHKGSDLPTHKFGQPEAFVDALHDALLPAMEQVGKENIRGIGVGAPNGNYYSGTIEYAPNLPWKGLVPLAQLITEKFGLPASLTNDANAAAVGEMTYGAARGMRDFIMITLGTGVGSGIVVNGQVVYGHDGNAGELGHTIIRPGGRLHWSTGLEGSLESYASATGIVVTAKELLAADGGKSALHALAPEKITSKAIYESAVSGDALALEVYRFTGQVLGEALANFIMFSSPEAIVLFGGVIKAGDLLLTPTREHMERNLLPIFRNKVKLVFSELKEADAAILGASALAWER
ncbi:ROK family protein [Paraflavisolibacter sp. H34]|uniref:ROK family protein n=1 Tax=Huijunlia imazamoxiresistens TaxID=3127457 RepID=UPI003019BD2D